MLISEFQMVFSPPIFFRNDKKRRYYCHTCEPVASKNLEKFSGELAKKLENFVGLRYIKNVGK